MKWLTLFVLSIVGGCTSTDSSEPRASIQTQQEAASGMSNEVAVADDI